MATGLRRAVPLPVRRAVRRHVFGIQPAAYSACYAPQVMLYFQPDGDVRACCRNQNYPLGNIGTQRLPEIWDGPRRQELVERLAVDDFSRGCEGCKWEIDTVGREASFPRPFDDEASLHLTSDPRSGTWPHAMEFNLSNTCNLQCLQCNGDLSSSIRIHREKRPPLPKVYDDQFFDDLVPFLPHLGRVQFAGGEPFMAAENYRVWELLAELAPQLEVQVVTNATQWNKRVEAILEKVRFAPTFSLDGITAETYERVRAGADHDRVMANVDRFCAYCERVGTEPLINFCLMAQNYHEFGPLLQFAERRGIRVYVSVVHYPEHASIARLEPARIAEIHRHLRAEYDEVLSSLDLNAELWVKEVDRIGSWLEREAPEAEHDAYWKVIDTVPFGLARWTEGGGDEAQRVGAARAVLADFDAEAPIHDLLVLRGERIAEASPDIAAALGAGADDLVGAPVDRVQELFERRYGPATGQELLAETEDTIDVLTTFDGAEVRTVIVALRDATGFAATARLLFAVRERSLAG